MSGPTIGVLWGLIISSLVLLILAGVIIVSLLFYGRRVRDHEQRFRLLFDKIHDSLILIDESGLIIQTNDAIQRLTGFTRQDLLGIQLSKIMPDADCDRLLTELGKIRKNGLEYAGEITIKDKSFSSLQVEAVGGPIKINGKELILLSLRDLTYRHKIEQELRNKNFALKEIMTNIEEERLQFKLQIAETIDQVLMPTLHKAMNADAKNIETLKLLEQNLLELSISSGGLLRHYSKLSPREIEVCNLIKNGATSKEIAISLNISETTVKKHREKIRKKLVIAKKDVNLNSFLNSNKTAETDESI